MKIHIAYRGDGVYQLTEHKGIYRIARELGFDQGLSDGEIREIVSSTLEDYHQTCLPSPDLATQRFNQAADELNRHVKGNHAEKRLICGYLLSVATADHALAPGELAILNELEAKWGLQRTRMPF